MVMFDIINILGPVYRKEGIEYVFADNDSKLDSKTAVQTWAKQGIKLWPSGGKNAWDRHEDGFPTNCPDLVPNNQALHNEFKHFDGMFYDQWDDTPPSRQRAGRFFNLIKQTMKRLPQSSVRKAIGTKIDLQGDYSFDG